MEYHFNIKIVPYVGAMWIADMIMCIKEADDRDKELTMIMPNPAPATYMTIMETNNRFKLTRIKS